MWQSEKKNKETQGLVGDSGKKEKGKLIGGFQAVGKDGEWYSYFFQCRRGGGHLPVLIPENRYMAMVESGQASCDLQDPK